MTSDHLLIRSEEVLSVIDNRISPELTDAQRLHARFVLLGKVTEYSGVLLRDTAAEMYLSGGYAEIGYATFRDWLEAAVQEAGLSPTTQSALATFIEYAVDPVSKRLVTRPNGQPITVDDLLAMPVRKTGRIASAARHLLTADSGPDLEGLKAVINTALDPSVSGEDLTEIIRSMGASSARVPRALCRVVEHGSHTVYLIVADSDRQATSLNATLEQRVTWSSTTLDCLIDVLRELNPND